MRGLFNCNLMKQNKGDGRLSVNSGIGYRKLSDDKTSLTGLCIYRL